MGVEDFDFGVCFGFAFGGGGVAAGGGGGGVEEVVCDVFEVAEVGERIGSALAVADHFFGGVETADTAGEAGAFGGDGVVAEGEGVGGGVWLFGGGGGGG